MRVEASIRVVTSTDCTPPRIYSKNGGVNCLFSHASLDPHTFVTGAVLRTKSRKPFTAHLDEELRNAGY